MAAFKTSKCFEGHGPLLIWAVSALDEAGVYQKFYLVADAQQKSFGVRAEKARGDDVKLNGAVVTLVRKHAKTGAIGRIFRDPASGHIWLPLFISRGEHPDFWVQLAHGTPPELRFIDAVGTALVRKSSQGSYTKRWALPEGLPSYPPAAPMEELNAELGPKTTAAELEPAAAEAAAPASAALPDYQRSARDRLARRLKTVRKAVSKAKAQSEANTVALAFEQQAQLLQEHLVEVVPGQTELVVLSLDAEIKIALDPALSPGQNLSELFSRAKKARRGEALLAAQVSAAEAEASELSAQLERLRAAPLPLAAVTSILKHFGLTTAADGLSSPAQAAPVPYRTFYAPPTSGAGVRPGDRGVRLLVGKSAADSDELCRTAQGNDWWVHIVGTTGSHVLIPARQLRGAPTPQLLRAAAILALHFSKAREDQAGEVYITRRQHIKKRKGMAPGLWQVEQAETMFFRYEGSELNELLNSAGEGAPKSRGRKDNDV